MCVQLSKMLLASRIRKDSYDEYLSKIPNLSLSDKFDKYL